MRCNLSRLHRYEKAGKKTMIQEYLFMDDTHRAAVENYLPDKVAVEFSNIDNATCWTVTYSLSGENEDTAATLSKVNDYVMENYSPTVLTNESAAYFNRRLYPEINEFERKLRKLLYLKSAIYQGDKRIDNIRDLESKDLGEIFVLLFTDEDFVKAAKTKVNEKSWQYAKKEIIETLAQLNEDTTWDRLLGNAAVTTLNENFLTVKRYRNDVMHAHNINTKIYRAAKKLFEDINKQLDVEIGTIIHTAEMQSEETASTDFNDTLSTALHNHNLSTATQNTSGLVSGVSGDQYLGAIEALKRMHDFYTSPEYVQMKESLRQFRAYKESPELAHLQQELRNIRDFSAQLSALRQLTSQTDSMLPPSTASEDPSSPKKSDNSNP